MIVYVLRIILNKIDHMIREFQLTKLDSQKKEYVFAFLYYDVKNDLIRFRSGTASGVVWKSEQSWSLMRKACGENLLMMKGLPLDGPRLIKLDFGLEAQIRLGVLNSYRLKKKWKGSSFVGEIEVIKYI
jgi:hypothetical protein